MTLKRKGHPFAVRSKVFCRNSSLEDGCNTAGRYWLMLQYLVCNTFRYLQSTRRRQNVVRFCFLCGRWFLTLFGLESLWISSRNKPKNANWFVAKTELQSMKDWRSSPSFLICRALSINETRSRKYVITASRVINSTKVLCNLFMYACYCCCCQYVNSTIILILLLYSRYLYVLYLVPGMQINLRAGRALDFLLLQHACCQMANGIILIAISIIL